MNGKYVKYISISWSNYGEIFVVADKRMPNMILVLFRGTYSMKTLRISTDINNLYVKSVGCSDDNEKFLYGFYKISVEMIHNVIESMVYLATNFLGAIPDKANDNAVVNFIVTHIGKILFKISMSRIHPIITTIPTISKEIPDTVVIRLLKEFLFCVSR